MRQRAGVKRGEPAWLGGELGLGGVIGLGAADEAARCGTAGVLAAVDVLAAEVTGVLEAEVTGVLDAGVDVCRLDA